MNWNALRTEKDIKMEDIHPQFDERFFWGYEVLSEKIEDVETLR